ncbi:hypothetical protein BS47DRAFT_1384266 [Hydnum rufescens UP504]|uniref:Uncharacterized protein n=1 Tax=Hydnum rufescens UP504 TaxID=1448309 RepID=A0A9P6AQT7_9AGAM|nr:hypothetical protein BS47DRAFT_1384266 [Hydnum rufescens UP504]
MYTEYEIWAMYEAADNFDLNKVHASVKMYEFDTEYDGVDIHTPLLRDLLSSAPVEGGTRRTLEAHGSSSNQGHQWWAQGLYGGGRYNILACNHFATLLTRGSEDSDNEAKGSGRSVIAVGGKLTSQVIQLTMLGSLDETDGALENVEAIAMQNLTSYSTDAFQCQVIQPSETTLAKLAQRQALDIPARYDEELHRYAQDLLAGIQDLRAFPSTNFDLFRQFVLRSCLAKIGHCLASDKYLLPRPLDEILHGWKLFPNETFMSKQILVPESLRQPLVELGAPVIGDWCQWSPETASRWIEILREMLGFAKSAVRDCRICTRSDVGRSSIKIDDRAINLADMALSLLMFVVTLPLRDVFYLDSMRVHLSGHDLASEAHSALGIVDDENAPKLPKENISTSVLHYLYNAVAWHCAPNTSTGVCENIWVRSRSPWSTLPYPSPIMPGHPRSPLSSEQFSRHLLIMI